MYTVQSDAVFTITTNNAKELSLTRHSKHIHNKFVESLNNHNNIAEQITDQVVGVTSLPVGQTVVTCPNSRAASKSVLSRTNILPFVQGL